MKISVAMLLVITVIVILVILILTKKDQKECPRESQLSPFKVPKCLSNSDCKERETCTAGFCQNKCSDCDFELQPFIHPHPSGFGSPSGKSVNFIQLQSTGKMLTMSSWSSHVVRHNSDGTLDLTFGVGGLVTTRPLSPFTQTRGLLVLPDDSFLVMPNETVPIVMKFNQNGILDLTFGTAGIYTATTGQSYITAYALSPDNFIFVNIYKYTGMSSGYYLIKMSSTGVLDPTFGTSGILYLSPIALTEGVININFGTIGLRPDGKIVWGGNLETSTEYTFGALRLNSNGTLDVSYGSNGVCIVPGVTLGPGAELCNDKFAYSATHLTDGTVFVHGYTNLPTYTHACDSYPYIIIKINPNGELDTNYGENGAFIFNESGTSYNAYYENKVPHIFTPCDGGQIVVMNNNGSPQISDELNANGMIIKVTSKGKLDTSFAIVRGAFRDEFYNTTLYHEGKIYVGGARLNRPYVAIYSCNL